jgi:hypothetical protein
VFFIKLLSAKQGLHVKGKDLREGIPTTRWINEVDLYRVLERPFGLILNCIQQTMPLGFGLNMYGTTNISNLTATLVDPIVMTVMMGASGGAIGWVLGRE